MHAGTVLSHLLLWPARDCGATPPPFIGYPQFFTITNSFPVRPSQSRVTYTARGMGVSDEGWPGIGGAFYLLQ